MAQRQDNESPRRSGSASGLERAQFVLALIAVLVSTAALGFSLALTFGWLSPWEATGLDRVAGRSLSGFGVECRTTGVSGERATGSDCKASWAIEEVRINEVSSDGGFDGTMRYAFGSELALTGRISNSLLYFESTDVVREESTMPSGTDVGCSYYLVPEGDFEYRGHWSGCDGEENTKEGTIWVALEVDKSPRD